ncbi:hypothetical protein TWF106_000448 [Orbilia oligospora]|uniref:Uncharacterized protein n=1 Tax=Orbilia oligospora TaxID=2813651 RepID=A0A7C8QF09_ORBOL|nr:hypothetical protein TWF106_000448 [Orbilia oligospora]
MGNPKNHSRNVHAVVVYGSDKWDLNCTHNFVSAIRSCYSRSIIPYALSTCTRDELIGLISSASSEVGNEDSQQLGCSSQDHEIFLESGVVPPITDSETFPDTLQSDSIPTVNEEGNFPPANQTQPTPTPTPQETQEILDVLRPFYHSVQQEDIKLELRSHLQALAPKLKSSSRLLIIICAQAVHTSGCIVLGRTITNQDIMEYIDNLPLRSTAVIASIAAGSDDRKEIPGIWEAADELGIAELQRHHASAGVVYTTAKIEIIKPLTEISVEREVRVVRDVGVMRLKSQTFMEDRLLKLGPWAYSSDEWKAVDGVASYVEQVIDKHIVVKRFNPLNRAKDTIERAVRIVRKEEPLDLSIYYLELKLEEMKKKSEEEDSEEGLAYEHARKGMLALEGIMKRVVEQNRNCMHAAHIISSSSLFQQRVEETLRFIERSDVRAEAFLQGAYKGGMLKFIDASDIRLHVEARERLLETVRASCPDFDTIMMPPRDCVGLEYWEQADRILKIIQGHVWRFRWFRIERFLEYMAANL